MKAPAIKDLSKTASTMKENPIRAAVIEQETIATEKEQERQKTKPRSFTLNGQCSEHINALANQMAMKEGKPVSASKALRAIIEFHINGGK